MVLLSFFEISSGFWSKKKLIRLGLHVSPRTSWPSQISGAPFPKTIDISSLKKEHCKICNLTVVGNFNKHLLNSHYKEELRIAIPSETRSCASCNNSKFSSYAEAIFHFMTKHNICRKFYDKEQM